MRYDEQLRGIPVQISLDAAASNLEYAIDNTNENETIVLDHRTIASEVTIASSNGEAVLVSAPPPVLAGRGLQSGGGLHTASANATANAIANVTANVTANATAIPATTYYPLVSVRPHAAGLTYILVGITFSNVSGAPAVHVAGGVLEMQSTTLANAAGLGGLLISAGRVHAVGSAFSGNVAPFSGGAVRATGGATSLLNCTLSGNLARSGSAIAVSGDATRVTVTGSLLQGNIARERGTLHVLGGGVMLEAGTRFVGNTAGGGGHSISHTNGRIVYGLPTPLGHWLASTFRCIWYRIPCPVGDDQCVYDDQPLLPSQPCDLATQPELEGRVITILPLGSIDEDYPYLCSSGLYGSTSDVSVQSTPQCQGYCPGGYKCGPATVVPVACSPGTYCERGSSLSTPCPSGTFSAKSAIATKEDCEDCPAGTACYAGSTSPQPCRPGSFTAVAGEAVCAPCPSGTFQPIAGATGCELCRAGRRCPEGSVVELPISAGLWSNRTGVTSDEEAFVCPIGSYCPEGSTAPQLCAAGTYGEEPSLADFRCSGSCAPGHVCPAGSTSATALACPAGTYNPLSGMGEISACRLCPVGRYCARGAVQATPCPVPFTTLGEGTRTKYGCVCKAKLYAVGAPGPGMRNDSTRCLECPGGSDCELPGATLETLWLMPGYWRVTTSSSLLKPCNPSELCIGTAAALAASANRSTQAAAASATQPSALDSPAVMVSDADAASVVGRSLMTSEDDSEDGLVVAPMPSVCRQGHTGPYW